MTSSSYLDEKPQQPALHDEMKLRNNAFYLLNHTRGQELVVTKRNEHPVTRIPSINTLERETSERKQTDQKGGGQKDENFSKKNHSRSAE